MRGFETVVSNLLLLLFFLRVYYLVRIRIYGGLARRKAVERKKEMIAVLERKEEGGKVVFWDSILYSVIKRL